MRQAHSRAGSAMQRQEQARARAGMISKLRGREAGQLKGGSARGHCARKAITGIPWGWKGSLEHTSPRMLRKKMGNTRICQPGFHGTTTMLAGLGGGVRTQGEARRAGLLSTLAKKKNAGALTIGLDAVDAEARPFLRRTAKT